MELLGLFLSHLLVFGLPIVAVKLWANKLEKENR